MRRTLTAALASLVLSVPALTGCTEKTQIEVPRIDLSEVDLPDVDWDKYAPEIREEVEGLGAAEALRRGVGRRQVGVDGAALGVSYRPGRHGTAVRSRRRLVRRVRRAGANRSCGC